jgi:hypothetical protein
MPTVDPGHYTLNPGGSEHLIGPLLEAWTTLDGWTDGRGGGEPTVPDTIVQIPELTHINGLLGHMVVETTIAPPDLATWRGSQGSSASLILLDGGTFEQGNFSHPEFNYIQRTGTNGFGPGIYFMGNPTTGWPAFYTADNDWTTNTPYAVDPSVYGQDVGLNSIQYDAEYEHGLFWIPVRYRFYELWWDEVPTDPGTPIVCPPRPSYPYKAPVISVAPPQAQVVRFRTQNGGR